MAGRSNLRRWGTRLAGPVVAVVLVAGMAVGAVAPGAAQEATPVASPTTPATVSVNGRGTVMVEPDTASVVVGVDVTKQTLAEAQAEATTQMTAVIDALRAAGIDEQDIRTVNYSVNVLRDYDERAGTQGEVIGFQVANQVNVVVRDVARVGEVLDAVVASGANNIYGISFSVDDPSAAASQARTLAVEDARAKAEELAAAAGLTLGRVVTIAEGYPFGPVFGGGYAEGLAATGVPVQPGQTVVAVDVQVTYELVAGEVTAGTTPTATEGAGLTDRASLMAALAERGFGVAEIGTITGEPLFPNAQEGMALRLTGSALAEPAELQVYSYADAAAAAEDAGRILPDGSLPTVMITWVGPPHFFRQGPLVVIYVGSEPTVLQALRQLMGPQFAGAE